MEKKFLCVEDVLSDEIFFAWYFKASEEKIRAWNNWITANPQYKPLIDEAIAIMSQLHLTENNVSEQRTETSLQRLNSFLEAGNENEAPVKSIGSRRSFWWIAAALVLVLAGLGFWKFSGRQDQISFVAHYGETSTHQLPDGSEVILNANSTVILNKRWANGTEREVWLKGEAFFHVKKTPDNEGFIVHTDHFEVIVTGTQFDVVNRNGQSNVMLNEGKVKIKTTNGKEINMDPGEFLEFKNDEAEKRLVKNDSLLAWKDKRLIFYNTPLSKVVVIIKDHYGVDVELADDSVSNKTISGMLPNDNLDVLLQAINATNDLEVIHHRDKISIRNRQ